MPATYDSVIDLAAALRRTAEAHGRHEQEIGHPDPDWPDWYAQYMVDEQSRLSGQACPRRAHEQLRRQRLGCRLAGRALPRRVGC